MATDGPAAAYPRIEIVVAAAENNIIGRDGALPWHLPKDLRHFKRTTLGHPMLMGRRTFASFGKPLPGRRHIVLSRRQDWRPAGAEVFSNLDTALTTLADAERVFSIGGAGVFEATLPLASVLHLTRVHADIEGDVALPPIDWRTWNLVDEIAHPADERHAHAFSIRRYERTSPA